MAPADPPVAVVLTARPVEFDAVHAHLLDVEERFHPAGTAFYVGSLAGRRRQVALAEIGEGNNGTAVLTERAISFLRPDLLVFVGVAGRLMDDLELGDVVVPNRIYQLHSGMIDDEGFHRRPRSWEVNHRLVQIARRVARERTWLAAVPDLPDRPPAVFFRPIAAGEVVLNARVSEALQQIRDECEDAAAIEMESAGMAQAAFLNQHLPAIAVRGISDTASGDKLATDRAGWQARAARNAAAFAVTLLAELPVDEPVAPDELASRRAALADLAAAEAATATVYRTVLAKIAEPGLPRLAARAPELTEWLAGDPGLELLDALDREIAKARQETDRLRDWATELLDRRAELRGRFKTYEAMAVRLDVAEHAEIAAGRARAMDVLWTSPCDLGLATRVVNDYLRAVTAEREGRSR